MKTKYFITFLFIAFYTTLYGQEFAVELKQKPQTDTNYILTEDPEIIALSLKYETILKQSCPGAKTPELLLFYTLIGNGNKDTIINDYLATGKFEDTVREFEIIELDPDYINPILLNNSFVKVYPNPAKNTITISSEVENTQKMTIIIYDVAGKVVIRETENLPCELNIEHISSGVYYIQLFDKNNSLSLKKLIKL